MDALCHAGRIFHCLALIFALLFLQSSAETRSSVVFLDSHTHQYLRTHTSDAIAAISSGEIGAAVSVLLGFAPSSTLSADSSSKLNAILMPNPFDRPRHVLLIQATVAEGSIIKLSPYGIGSSRAILSTMVQSSEKVRIELPDEDQATSISFGVSDFEASEEVADKEISQFASWLGGSYIANDLEPVEGELVFLLPSGVEMKLHLSKMSDNKFIRSLISLVGKVKGAIEIHDSSPGSKNLAGLITGYFNGIKALQDYGPEGVSQQGTELFLMAISKILETTRSELKDQVVAVIVLKEADSSQPEEVLNIVSGSLPNARFLEETTNSTNSTTVAEIALVRKTVAWTTGIVLIIATYLGIYLLMYMPITKDTLLYSNVKLD